MSSQNTKPTQKTNKKSTPTKRHRQRNYDKFDSFIVELAKLFVVDKEGKVSESKGKVGDDKKAFGMTRDAVANIDSMLKFMLEGFVNECMALMTRAQNKTIGLKEIWTVVRLKMPQDLAKFLIETSKKTIETYRGADASVTNHTRKAGLHIPVRRVANMIRFLAGSNISLSKETPIAMASVLESLALGILSKSSVVAAGMNRQRITPQHLLLGINQNNALKQVLLNKGVIGRRSGVVPFVAPQLLKNKSKKAKA